MVAVPFLFNIGFNALFTPLQFGLKNNFLALIDIILVFVTIVWAMGSIFRHDKMIAYLQIPYLVWVTLATVLQLSITFLNQ